jgi:hypothetical protein
MADALPGMNFTLSTFQQKSEIEHQNPPFKFFFAVFHLYIRFFMDGSG